jgi:hypothetical protein
MEHNKFEEISIRLLLLEEQNKKLKEELNIYKDRSEKIYSILEEYVLDLNLNFRLKKLEKITSLLQK